MKNLSTKSNSIKTKLLVYLMAVVLLFSGVGITLLTNNFGSNGNDADASNVVGNSYVMYDSEDSLGRFMGGYIYQYTDSAKINGFRAGTLVSDVTKVTVDETATHGSAKNPYVISTTEDWEKLVKLCGGTGIPGSYVVLANDIDFTGVTVHPLAWFDGIFYGQGHTLSNITIDTDCWVYWNGTSYVNIGTNTKYCGAFGLILRSNALSVTDLVINNYHYIKLNVANGNDTSAGGHSFASGLVGILQGTSKTSSNILNVHTKGTISGNFSTINHNRCGGFIGLQFNTAPTTFYRCTGNVTMSGISSTNGWPGAGSIVGHTNPSSTIYILDCVGTVNAIHGGSSSFCGGAAIGWQMGHTHIDGFVGSK